MPTASLDGLDLHYEDRGAGPVLLLIAGIPAVASDGAPLAEPMSAERRVIAYRARSCT